VGLSRDLWIKLYFLNELWIISKDLWIRDRIFKQLWIKLYFLNELWIISKDYGLNQII
jgi:hypothetical protein